MKKNYTHIFFDLDNTLWDFKTNGREALRITYHKYNLDRFELTFDTFYEEYSKNNTELWIAYRKKEVYKSELIRLRFQKTFDSLEIDGIDPEEMNAVYLHEMSLQSALLGGAIPLLDYLKSKKYKLFIITNGFREVQHKKLQHTGLVSYFDKVFISEDIKVPKPGREIFEYAIKSSNAKKSKSIMIGDDWDVDILGALNFGIDVVYVGDKQPLKTETKHIVKKVISLGEIADLL
ncbi:YjjG family noncanonical pyrimidine nucleotidase [Draconibacterium mangrovi]|uniref:YjjG family noncanonical pyrimidine nucleotidase n=1 Tax=Draconibacterium mangrovi TaxID=2697469 RepID=UPI0013CFDA86|nr:YjjG family noncanonical pyrimidine nucleotidase [Draconibacterium mangrovi]